MDKIKFISIGEERCIYLRYIRRPLALRLAQFERDTSQVIFDITTEFFAKDDSKQNEVTVMVADRENYLFLWALSERVCTAIVPKKTIKEGESQHT